MEKNEFAERAKILAEHGSKK